MFLHKYTFKELRKNLFYILFDVGSWNLFFYLLKNERNWINIQNNVKDNYSILQHKKLGFMYYSNLSYRRAIISEWEVWNKYYDFPFNLRGKTVLDIGSGCGETALLYFNKGADKVICIEQNIELLPFLNNNIVANGLNIDFRFEPFNLDHLFLHFDAVKMDIEGGEKELLRFGKIDFPLVLEIHSKDLVKAFQEKGFTTSLRLRSTDKYIVIMNNFKKLNLNAL